MTVRRQQILWGATFGVLLSGRVLAEAGSPQGDEESVRYHLVYDAPVECPSKQVLRDRITRRINTDWEASPAQTAGTLSVAIRQDGQRYHALLTLADRWERVAFRELDGDLCEATLSELTVVAVAAIESRLGAQPAYFEFGASFGADWRTNLLAAGGGGLVGLRWPTSKWSAQLAFTYSGTTPGHASIATDVAIHFELFSLRLDLCPFEPRVNEALSFPLCAGAEGGWLHASAVNSSGASAPALNWATFGLTPQIRLRRGYYFFQLSPRFDLLAHPQRLTDTPRRDGQPSRVETIHDFYPIGFALFATFGARLP